jgi:uncharacterized membrane protein YtjA (UPF0391 family)
LDFGSLRPHASHIPFEVRRRLVVSLIITHIGYGGIVYAGADAASQCIAFRINFDIVLSIIKNKNFEKKKTEVEYGC